MNAGTLLEAVEAVARRAGRVALRSFGSVGRVERKADGSEVSEADRAAEQTAREWIGARFPRDAILGEEHGETNPGAARRWFVDPIDGTAAFVRGVPLWGTLVAVAENDRVLAGAIYCPALHEMACAALGEGCWWNGRRAQVSAVATIGEANILTTSALFRGGENQAAGWHRLAAAAGTVRGWGDCYGYLLVATGRADVMLDPVLASWDSAALMPVIAEAGGVFTDWSGRVTGFGGSAVATNSALAREARTILGVPAP